MKTIILTHAVAKDLDALPVEDRRAVERGIDAFAKTGVGDVKKLVGQDGYRLRVGRYRALFTEDGPDAILIVYIGKRETTSYRRKR